MVRNNYLTFPFLVSA